MHLTSQYDPHDSLDRRSATLFTAAAHAQDPCSLLTPDQIKAVLSVPVNPGQPGGTKDSPDCTWKDAKGEDRVYVSLKSRDTFNVTRAQMAGRYLVRHRRWRGRLLRHLARRLHGLPLRPRHAPPPAPSGQHPQRHPPGQRSRRKSPRHRNPPQTLSAATE